MKKPFYKKWWFILILVVIVIGAIGNAIEGDDTTKEKSDETTQVPASTNAEKESEEPANEEVKKEEDTSVKDAEIYKNEIVIHLDAFQDEYDKYWTNNWVTTFEGVSNGTIDRYKAYETLNSLEKYYTGLGNKIRNTDLPKLSKENQKILKDYLSDFKSAILTRSRAASEAADMFDKGEFKPSEMEKIQSTVGYADQEIISAMTNRAKLEQNLGLAE